MSRALCAPGKAPRVVRLLEVVSSEDAVSVAQHTPRQSTGALLYGVLPKTACSVKRGIHQLSTKLPSLLHSSAGRKGAENPLAVPLRGRQGWHWGGRAQDGLHTGQCEILTLAPFASLIVVSELVEMEIVC